MSAKHIARCEGLTGTAASVNVDVYGENGVLIGNITNASIVRVGTTTTYSVDLRSNNLVSSLALPKDGAPEEKLYHLVWKDDAPSAIHRGELVEGQRQRLQPGRMYHREDVVYPSTTIPTRGITSGVIAAGKPSYIKHELAPDFDFATPEFTWYDVFYYAANGEVERRQPSLSVPNP